MFDLDRNVIVGVSERPCSCKQEVLLLSGSKCQSFNKRQISRKTDSNSINIIVSTLRSSTKPPLPMTPWMSLIHPLVLHKRCHPAKSYRWSRRLQATYSIRDQCPRNRITPTPDHSHHQYHDHHYLRIVDEIVIRAFVVAVRIQRDCSATPIR